MTGIELRNWVKDEGYSVQEICNFFDISVSGLYVLYKANTLRRPMVLALAHAGCEIARTEVESLLAQPEQTTPPEAA